MSAGNDESNGGIAAVKGNGNEQVAYNILALLAREIPKLVDPCKSQSTAVPASNEQSNKRRRLNDDDTNTASLHYSEGVPQLPENEHLEEIVTAYFFHLHPWIPMIHQKRFLQRLADETERPALTIILHAMTIAASKFVPGAKMDSSHTLRIRKWVVYTAMGGLSLENLQALIILAFNDIGNGNAAGAWSIIGSLTRTVEYMQLTQEQEDGEYRPFCQPYASLAPTDDWTELEERRRVFWNVFLLDRFCSVTMGWNTSLTSDDVCRRLPCDGHLWRKQKPVLTPYFGIWDKSRGRIGNPIGYASRYPSPGRTGHEEQASNVAAGGSWANSPTDMSTVGALAYHIEATESMSRVMSYFLQQKINVRDQTEMASWLTRFKELDLRLVHWKMLLPQKWKANPNLTRHVPLMDPNLTTAHVTHNASMILLHQPIAYPPPHWGGFRNRLPSSTCSSSAEACYSAGIEISTITEKYLSKSPPGSPIGSQYAFCLFIAARVLLIHWRHTAGTQLPPAFWSLMQSLDHLSTRWTAFADPPLHEPNLFTAYSARLKELYNQCLADPGFCINIMDYTSEGNPRHGLARTVQQCPAWLGSPVLPNVNTALQDGLDASEFDSISQIMLDQDFVDMDRVITFDDGSMFAAVF